MPRKTTPCGRSSCGTRRSPSPRGLWPCAPRTGASTSSIRTTATKTSRRSSIMPRRTASPRTTTTPPSAPSPAPPPPPASPTATLSPKIPSASPPNTTTTPSPSSTTTTVTTTPSLAAGWDEINSFLSNIPFVIISCRVLMFWGWIGKASRQNSLGLVRMI